MPHHLKDTGAKLPLKTNEIRTGYIRVVIESQTIQYKLEGTYINDKTFPFWTVKSFVVMPEEGRGTETLQ